MKEERAENSQGALFQIRMAVCKYEHMPKSGPSQVSSAQPRQSANEHEGDVQIRTYAKERPLASVQCAAATISQ